MLRGGCQGIVSPPSLHTHAPSHHYPPKRLSDIGWMRTKRRWHGFIGAICPHDQIKLYRRIVNTFQTTERKSPGGRSAAAPSPGAPSAASGAVPGDGLRGGGVGDGRWEQGLHPPCLPACNMKAGECTRGRILAFQWEFTFPFFNDGLKHTNSQTGS